MTDREKELIDRVEELRVLSSNMNKAPNYEAYKVAHFKVSEFLLRCQLSDIRYEQVNSNFQMNKHN